MARTSPQAANVCPVASKNLSWAKLVLDDENTTQPANNGDIAYVNGTGIRFKMEGSVYTIPTSAGSTAYNDIGDAAASGSITMGAHTGTYTSATANWGGLILENSHSNPTAGASLLNLKYTADADAHGVFIDCLDNSGAVSQFKVGADGAVTITGNATGTDALTLTAGDITLTDGMLVMTTGGLDVNSTTGNALDVNAAKLQIANATGKITGSATADIELNTDKFTVDATNGNTLVAGTFEATGASTLTGNVTMAGDLQVDGSLTFGGNWTVAAKLTVDELVLDTDGSISGLTASCYVISDNTGDLNLNCLNGKAVHIQENGSDEYDFTDASLDMNANALDNCGFLILNAATAPANTEVYAVNDQSGDLTLNAVSAKQVHLAIAGTDEFNFSATEFELAAGNDIQFLGNDGILDSAGNEVILVEAVGSAVNYLLVKNAATANPIILSCEGTANKGFQFENDQDEEILILTPVDAADTEITIINSAAGRPIIRATGVGDQGIEVQNAAGEITLATLSTADPLNWLSVSNSNTGVPVQLMNAGEDDVGFTFDAKNSEPMLRLACAAADCVDYITITAAAAAGEPVISATGATANIDIVLTPKGTGLVSLGGGGFDLNTTKLYGGTAADGNLLLESTENATKGRVITTDGDEGIGIGETADRAGAVGDNVLHIGDGAAAPAGALANGVSLYSEGGECKVLDAAGNGTTLSPHTKDGDFIIKSYAINKDKTLIIHLEKLVNALVKDHKNLRKYIEMV